jgi:hypothetical protein
MKPSRAVPILLTLLVGAGGGLSCADIAAPGRSDVYEWRFIASSGPGTTDTLSFHWPRSSLPVRIWTEDAFDLPAHVAHGIELWKAAFLYGEFDAIQVSDSSTADVIVRAESPVKLTASEALASRSAPECEGGTDIVPPPGVQQIQYPVRVFLLPRFAPESPGVTECLALTATHELGHALGILAHSPEDADIMFVDPVVSSLSSRDRATIERAYHVESNLTIPAR